VLLALLGIHIVIPLVLLLYPLFENAIVDQSVDEDCNLSIFEMIANTYEPMKKLVNRNF
jgi:hypothetical protein